MIKVIFDTNFLIYAIDFKGDIFQAMEESIGQQIEKILLRPIQEEIQHLAVCGSNKIQRQAQRVLELIQDKQLKFQQIALHSISFTDVDQMITAYAKNNQCYIATNDKELRKTLRKAGIPMFFIRQRTQIGVLR
jgi:rRNA-processing protein FCF1